jgi:oligo-1,6-glucosidase
MTNGAFDSLDEIMDIESHNVDKMAKSLGILNPWRWHLIRKTSRDNARTPMQWCAGENAGFTSGKPWLKLNPNFGEVNVEEDGCDPDGIIAFFKKLNSLRKTNKTLINGDFKEIYQGRSVYAYSRTLGKASLTALFNFSRGEKKIPRGIVGKTVISNYQTHSDRLRPYEFRLVSTDRSIEDDK